MSPPPLATRAAWAIGANPGTRRTDAPRANLFISLADGPEYTSAYSGEFVRLGPEDHSVVHVERCNHRLYFIAGSGEVTIGSQTRPVRPGSYAKVKAGERDSLRNLGGTDMLVLTIYDPPRPRT